MAYADVRCRLSGCVVLSTWRSTASDLGEFQPRRCLRVRCGDCIGVVHSMHRKPPPPSTPPTIIIAAAEAQRTHTRKHICIHFASYRSQPVADDDCAHMCVCVCVERTRACEIMQANWHTRSRSKACTLIIKSSTRKGARLQTFLEPRSRESAAAVAVAAVEDLRSPTMHLWVGGL